MDVQLVTMIEFGLKISDNTITYDAKMPSTYFFITKHNFVLAQD